MTEHFNSQESAVGQAARPSEIVLATLVDEAERERTAPWRSLRRAPAAKVYHVPTRFGMSGILGITTLTALVFGGIHQLAFLNSRYEESRTGNPFLYTWLGLLIFATCLVQMKYGTQPRSASIGIGALLLPVVSLGAALVSRTFDEFEMLFVCMPVLILFGALTGYLAGALTAGTFMVVEKLEQTYQRPPRPQRCVLFDSEPELEPEIPAEPHAHNEHDNLVRREPR